MMILNMILFDFEVDEEELADNLGEEENPLNAPWNLITLTYFMMPVRLQINGKDLFPSKLDPNNPWVGLPIVNLATSLYYRIKNLPKLKKFSYDLPDGVGILDFILEKNNKVRVIFKQKKIDEIVHYSELLEAFENFRKKVIKFLNDRVPQMQDHPYWGPWIRGEIEYKPVYDIFEKE